MTCEHEGCENEATVAIRSLRPTRANLWTKIWWDESAAPKAANRLCSECATDTLTALVKVLA